MSHQTGSGSSSGSASRSGGAGGAGGAGGGGGRLPEVDPLAGENTGSLHAPWRMDYIESVSKSETPTSGAAPPSPPSPPSPTPTLNPTAAAAPAGPASAAAPKGSFFVDYWEHPERDQANSVIMRSDRGMILLNAFPYANGHLLVALGTARARLVDYTREERAALWELTDLAAELMEEALEPQGINIGVNQGRAAGAGVPQHLHVHLVPRWSGDVNFMSVTAKVRVIPSSLETMGARFRATWERVKARGPQA